LREDTHRLEEEKATLEEMVESHDELLMEIARETGLDRMGEDEDDEEEEEDGGDATAPPAAAPPPLVPPAAVPEEIDEEGPMEAIPEQEAPVSHEVILVDVEPVVPQVRLYHALMRDYEENPLKLEDDFDDLMMTQAKTTLTWTSSFPMMKVMIGIESLSLSLKIRIKNKFFGFA
jgi:hypothetical protein